MFSLLVTVGFSMFGHIASTSVYGNLPNSSSMYPFFFFTYFIRVLVIAFRVYVANPEYFHFNIVDLMNLKL